MKEGERRTTNRENSPEKLPESGQKTAVRGFPLNDFGYPLSEGPSPAFLTPKCIRIFELQMFLLGNPNSH